MNLFRSLLAVLVVAGMAGCAGSRDMATQAPHPLEGAWSYTLDSPQGVFTGTLTFADGDVGLTGEIAMDDAPVEASLALTDVAFDGETMQLTFSFDSGDYGVMEVSLALDGDTLNGTMKVVDFGLDVPLAASRKTE